MKKIVSFIAICACLLLALILLPGTGRAAPAEKTRPAAAKNRSAVDNPFKAVKIAPIVQKVSFSAGKSYTFNAPDLSAIKSDLSLILPAETKKCSGNGP